MSLSGLVVFAVGIWATYASVRTIQRIGLRRFSVAVGRLGWDLGKVALGGTAAVAGAVVASAVSGEDDDSATPGFTDLDPVDLNDPLYDNRPVDGIDSPWDVDSPFNIPSDR